VIKVALNKKVVISTDIWVFCFKWFNW